MGLRYRPGSDGNLHRFRCPSGGAAIDYESQVGCSARNLDGDESCRGWLEPVVQNAVLLADSSLGCAFRMVWKRFGERFNQKYGSFALDIFAALIIV